MEGDLIDQLKKLNSITNGTTQKTWRKELIFYSP